MTLMTIINNIILLLMLFNTNTLVGSSNIRIFAPWIERTCKPLDKGKLTALPRFSFSQQNLKMSAMLKFEELPEVNSERWLSLKDFEGEVWKDVKGYESKYQISNYGRVKSKDRTRWNGHVMAKQKGRIMRLSLLNTRGGYYYASFHNKSGEATNKPFVHRMIAEAFIENPQNFPCVNHKNENSRDNRLCNIEWCTYAYNNAYGTAQSRAQATRVKRGISKPVDVCDNDGNVLEHYISIGQASKSVGIHKFAMSQYVHSGRKYKNGLHYKFANDTHEN